VRQTTSPPTGYFADQPDVTTFTNAAAAMVAYNQ
jgi:hypothetical protein